MNSTHLLTAEATANTTSNTTAKRQSSRLSLGSFIAALFMCAVGWNVNAATNQVSFRLMNSDGSAAAYKQVRIKPSTTSFPRAEGSAVAGIDYGFRVTDANGEFTNAMVTGTYDITFTNRFLASTFQITTPSTNYSGVLTAAELTTTGTNLPSNLVAWSATASDARRMSVMTNGVSVGARSNLNIIIGSNMVVTATNNASSNRIDVHISSAASGGSTVDTNTLASTNEFRQATNSLQSQLNSANNNQSPRAPGCVRSSK